MDPTQTLLHLGFLWDTVQGTIVLPCLISRLVDWTSKLLQVQHTTQEELESLVGTMISVTPAVWQSPLHYQALQRSLLASLRQGRNAKRIIYFCRKCKLDLQWWSDVGLRSNKVCSWRWPRPDVRLENWDFKLLHSEYQKVCRTLGVVPTLDAFASQRCHQLSRFMSWDTEDKAMAVNALVRQWDPVTWLFPPVPLIPEVLRIVEEQMIEAVLICPEWKGSKWWPQLSELIIQEPIRMPPASRCCKFPRGRVQSLPKLDPLIAVHISASHSI